MSASAAQQQGGDVFNQIDRNHDGVISREEFFANMQQGGAAPGTVMQQAPQMMVYSAGGVPMEPVATMMPGQAPPTMYSAPQTGSIAYSAPQGGSIAYSGGAQTASIAAGPQVTTQMLPPTAIVGEAVYATPQTVIQSTAAEPTGMAMTAPGVFTSHAAQQPVITLPHQGEIRTAPAVYVQAQAKQTMSTIQQAPPVVSYGAPQPTASLPATTVVGEAVYANVAQPAAQVPQEPVAGQQQMFQAASQTQSVFIQLPAPVYSGPPVMLPHEGEIRTAAPVYVNVSQKPQQVEVPAPVTTAVAHPVHTYAAGPPTGAEPVYMQAPETQMVPQMIVSPEVQVAPPVYLAGLPTTAEPVYIQQQQQPPAEPTQAHITCAAGPPQVAPPVYISSSGPPTTVEAVYITAPAAEPAQMAPRVMIAPGPAQVAAPVYMSGPTTTITADPVCVTAPAHEPPQQQFTIASGPPQLAPPVYLTAPAAGATMAPGRQQVFQYGVGVSMGAQYGVGATPMEPVATMIPGGGYAAAPRVYAAPPTVQYMQQHVQKGGDLFEQFDQNHDGMITRQEFAAVVVH